MITAALQESEGTPYLVQIVVYDLPDRDCAALSSNGEFSIADDGLTKYKNYVDQIAEQVAAYPDVRVVAVVEPDSLGNLVTNLNVAKCSGAQSAYKVSIEVFKSILYSKCYFVGGYHLRNEDSQRCRRLPVP